MALADGGLSFETSTKATVWGADFLSELMDALLLIWT
jgi:hypothetical protein